MAITDQDILSDIQSLLAEPLDGGATFPSGMWTPAEALGELNNQQQLLVAQTACILKRETIACVPLTIRQALPEDLIRLHRVVWVRAYDNLHIPLEPVSRWELDAADPDWRRNAGTPVYYQEDDHPTLTVSIVPAPIAAGSLKITYLPQPTLFLGAGTPSDLPDDLTVALTWGTLDHLLVKESRARDVARSKVASQRYDLFTESLKLILQQGGM
jgi:hypothetical protein